VVEGRRWQYDTRRLREPNQTGPAVPSGEFFNEHVEHVNCPLIKCLLQVRFVSVGVLVLGLLHAILLSMGSCYPTILLHYSLVSLGGAFSTNLKEANGTAKANAVSPNTSRSSG